MRVTSDLSHWDLQYIMMQTTFKSTYSKEKLSAAKICKYNTLIWLNYTWWETERKWIGIVVPKKWWISYTGNVSVKWTRKDPQISNNIPFQSNLKWCNIQSLRKQNSWIEMLYVTSPWIRIHFSGKFPSLWIVCLKVSIPNWLYWLYHRFTVVP